MLRCVFADEAPLARFLLAWGQKGDQPGEFYSPIGIAVSKKNEVCVADAGNQRIQGFEVPEPSCWKIRSNAAIGQRPCLRSGLSE
ncbi:MAG: hypothetical protein ACM3U2_04755 [Deltaproteobacteria bacterium]